MSIVDIAIIGAGPVGLMCTHLAELCGLSTIIVDKSAAPLEVGRADALNARTLQLLTLAKLFDELYPLGKTCNTSSVWANGRFVSRESAWWDSLEGCLHRHFLMLGQHYVEQLIDRKLSAAALGVKRSTTVEDVRLTDEGCLTLLSDGQEIASRYVIAADGSRSFVRNLFDIPFEITRPQLTWAVIDGVIKSDFPKVPEIISFQADTSDVAWIPREGDIDRFYVRMDVKEFSLDDALLKINRALHPHSLTFEKIVWFSQFSVKESVAEQFILDNKVFLVGDACHIHSVNGGQGLNTGLADAFNLIWKINMVQNFSAPISLLSSYEDERKPVAKSVIETSGALVRSTKYSADGTHAQDYVKIVQKHAGNITGMGIRYGSEGLAGSRLFDFEIFKGTEAIRLYTLLDYTKFTLLIFADEFFPLDLPAYMQVLYISSIKSDVGFWLDSSPYKDLAILVRPDSYIEKFVSLEIQETSGRKKAQLSIDSLLDYI